MISNLDPQAGSDPFVVNGRRYSLWPKFVLKKAEYIGGRLIDCTDGERHETEITDIKFEPNGKDSAMFEVQGKEFGCGSDVKYLGVDPELGKSLGEGWLGFSASWGAFGVKFAIKQKGK